MKKLKRIVKHYIKESLDSLLIDQIVSVGFGALTAWVLENNLQILDNQNIPTYMKFLLLGIAFFVVYTISVFMQLRPHRYKFRIKSLDIIVEYLGDTVNIYSTYTFKTNRFRANKMYTRKTWFSDEKFEFMVKTKGYKVEKIGRLGHDYEYNVIFTNFQYFWQTKTYKSFFSGTNKKRRFENFYWYDVICPTDMITIDVHIPQKYCTEKVKLKSFLDHEGSVGSSEDIIDYDGAYKWVIDTPKVGWSYKFEWNWSKKEMKLKKKKSKVYNEVER